MKRYLLLVMLFSTGCGGLFDNGSKTLTGDYTVGWIDLHCSMTISKGPLGLMQGQIYHLGWDSNFIIAKRHPKCDKNQTDYFIIDIEESEKEKYSQTRGVYGPLNENEFSLKFVELGIPKSVTFNYEPEL